MAALRVQACISQYQTEAAENDVPSARIIYFKAGIQWVIISGVEDNGLILPEQLDSTPAPSLVGLKWIREHLVSLIQDHQEGIHDKIVEIDMYTDTLAWLKRARGDDPY
ncbi:uncharacterized protein EDB91DRAFT_1086381 [Suillus paluster]|uniref:uncharacterized protein n=1 Tax=Suillus paluster TaxID=48578 RepID=UPI001B884CC7|nr:uncharacterized protein EDB91DRAFT_1086381 [Suillus paluster]KAG1727580.1 hypothetical protein EDB91DRAFT_1086381 [Suillus paluster]